MTKTYDTDSEDRVLRTSSGRNVTITVYDLGQCFACAADVRDADGVTLWSSREFPYGMRSSAFAAAEEAVGTL